MCHTLFDSSILNLSSLPVSFQRLSYRLTCTISLRTYDTGTTCTTWSPVPSLDPSLRPSCYPLRSWGSGCSYPVWVVDGTCVVTTGRSLRPSSTSSTPAMTTRASRPSTGLDKVTGPTREWSVYVSGDGVQRKIYSTGGVTVGTGSGHTRSVQKVGST